MATTASAERTGHISRARILDVAVNHFGAHGFKGGSMSQIAAASGISQPGLLHHFSSKSNLFLAALDERDRRAAEALDIDIDSISEMTFEALLEFYESIVRLNLTHHRPLVQFAHMTTAEAVSSDHPAHAWVVERMDLGRQLCVAALQRSIDNGTVRDDVNVEHVATMLIAISEGLETQWLIDESVDLLGCFQTFASILKAQLAPPRRIAPKP